MMYAIINGNRETATPRTSAVCPTCGNIVLAKCGKIKAWHWCHKANECDPWSEGETDWHLFWKSHVPKERVEVRMKEGDSQHRADLVTERGTVVEFQHSPIDAQTIAAREQFYGDMAWIFDCRTARIRKWQYYQSEYRFRWKRPKEVLKSCTKPVILHLGGTDFYMLEKMGDRHTTGKMKKLDASKVLEIIGIPEDQIMSAKEELENRFKRTGNYYSENTDFASMDEFLQQCRKENSDPRGTTCQKINT